MRRALAGLLAAAALLASPPSVDAAAGDFCSGEQLAVGANWSVCWEVRAHEGLVISHAFFTKPGVDRRVLSGASVAQIFVPYEPGQPRYHDVAYGLGPAMQPLPTAACHGVLLNGGKVCREIEDRGLAEFFCSEGNCHSAIGKGLVLWSASQMGAYNYVTRWAFHDDGTIEPALGLSGVLQFGFTAHTHNVYWRLDLDMDDPDGDRVEEFFRIVPAWSDGRAGASGWNPLLAETFRANELNTFRRWRISDARRTNAAGKPISYVLEPHASDGNYRSTTAEGFTRGELFVTRARDDERFVSTETSDLLSSYLNGESVDSTDLVLWYVIHEHHQPRLEDAPYMPTMWIRFDLVPDGFFDRSPLN
jgi:primary-amine oxidase